MKRGILAGLAVIGIAALVAANRNSTAINGLTAAIYNLTGIDLMNWQQKAALPENAQYVAMAHAAEAKYGIPHNMIVRQIYQECHFRADIISGQKVSSSGAVGIMQIIPRWHPGVDPLNPAAAIDYGARYLAQLHYQFGSWQLALQAYNWGPGNLSGYLAGNGTPLPAETANYSGQILADLASSGVAVA